VAEITLDPRQEGVAVAMMAGCLEHEPASHIKALMVAAGLMVVRQTQAEVVEPVQLAPVHREERDWHGR
jgi:hypothetical protein